ncbi:MAG: hypothetical protein HZB63_09165 [Deltaproteobacteria bacterium]|jgi:hypothetical protein|nr:hypothetical protein [Deltaproteobacteria bacterium]
MNGEGLAKALCFIFLCVFCWPFIGAADRAGSVMGIPSVILYLFLGWAVLVAVLAFISRKLED